MDIQGVEELIRIFGLPLALVLAGIWLTIRRRKDPQSGRHLSPYYVPGAQLDATEEAAATRVSEAMALREEARDDMLKERARADKSLRLLSEMTTTLDKHTDLLNEVRVELAKLAPR